jgi:hypothetical protein
MVGKFSASVLKDEGNCVLQRIPWIWPNDQSKENKELIYQVEGILDFFSLVLPILGQDLHGPEGKNNFETFLSASQYGGTYVLYMPWRHDCLYLDFKE